MIQRRIINQAGDTIVEVLIAIAVSAFVIATSYSIANKSLQTAINARERNQALNLLESQIASLKFREKTDPSNFAQFEVPSSYTGTGTAFHFCLDSTWLGPNDPNTTKEPPKSISAPECNPVINGTTYSLDISAMVTAATNVPGFLGPRTVYKFDISWPPVGNEPTARATIYYRF